MTAELDLKIDHVTLSVADLDVSLEFYRALLDPLGMQVVGEHRDPGDGTRFAGLGVGRKGALWLVESGRQTPQFHLCLRADSRANVREFHRAGIAAGGTDNGAPGIREIYHPAYYAAFVLDPDGQNIEAVCFEPETLPGDP